MGETSHAFHIVRLWEIAPDELLHDPALLPLAVLSKSEEPDRLLNRVAEEVKMIENKDERGVISTCTQVLAGLRFKKDRIQQVFKEGMMRESVIYQDILQEGVQEGWNKGWNKGQQEGWQKGQQEGELRVITRFLQQTYGPLDEALQEQLHKLSLSQLEELIEQMFAFHDMSEVKYWLQSKQNEK